MAFWMTMALVFAADRAAKWLAQATLVSGGRVVALAGVLEWRLTYNRGMALGFLADQDAKENGVFVDFFGRPASTPQGPAVFSLRCGAPVIPAFIVRQPKKGHRILLSPPIYGASTGEAAEEIQRLTEQMTQVMEERIRRYPDHWWWFQRRWITNQKTGESIESKP